MISTRALLHNLARGALDIPSALRARASAFRQRLAATCSHCGHGVSAHEPTRCCPSTWLCRACPTYCSGFEPMRYVHVARLAVVALLTMVTALMLGATLGLVLTVGWLEVTTW